MFLIWFLLSLLSLSLFVFNIITIIIIVTMLIKIATCVIMIIIIVCYFLCHVIRIHDSPGVTITSPVWDGKIRFRYSGAAKSLYVFFLSQCATYFCVGDFSSKLSDWNVLTFLIVESEIYNDICHSMAARVHGFAAEISAIALKHLHNCF